MKKTILIAAIVACSLTAIPAQAFFCSNFFGKSNQQQPQRFIPAYSYYQQQQYFIPYAANKFYTPRHQVFLIPSNGWTAR